MAEPKVFVKDLKEKDVFHTVFLVSEKAVLTDKNGKTYVSLHLNDVTGSLNARIWEKAEILGHSFQDGDFVWAKGHIQVFQGRKQAVVHDAAKAKSGEFKFGDYLKAAPADPEDMYREVLNFVGSVKDSNIQKLLQITLMDPKVKAPLFTSPAAKTIHHAYLGGLLEHILSICSLMKFLSEHYEFLDYDYLLFGAIYHDIGKIWELGLSDSIQYTQKGRLIGHMEIGCELIDDHAKEIPNFPEPLKDILKHIVLSHHGRLEYGSPKTPHFLEAMVVAMIDDLDSKINTMYHFMKTELPSGESWTRFHQGFERYLFLDVLRNLEGTRK